jgi:hypothetical protein
MAGASDALSQAPENQENYHQERHQVPVKRQATRLKKGDGQGLTENAVVLPKSIHPKQSQTSLIRSFKSCRTGLLVMW